MASSSCLNLFDYYIYIVTQINFAVDFVPDDKIQRELSNKLSKLKKLKAFYRPLEQVKSLYSSPHAAEGEQSSIISSASANSTIGSWQSCWFSMKPEHNLAVSPQPPASSFSIGQSGDLGRHHQWSAAVAASERLSSCPQCAISIQTTNISRAQDCQVCGCNSSSLSASFRRRSINESLFDETELMELELAANHHRLTAFQRQQKRQASRVHSCQKQFNLTTSVLAPLKNSLKRFAQGVRHLNLSSHSYHILLFVFNISCAVFITTKLVLYSTLWVSSIDDDDDTQQQLSRQHYSAAHSNRHFRHYYSKYQQNQAQNDLDQEDTIKGNNLSLLNLSTATTTNSELTNYETRLVNSSSLASEQQATIWRLIHYMLVCDNFTQFHNSRMLNLISSTLILPSAIRRVSYVLRFLFKLLAGRQSANRRLIPSASIRRTSRTRASFSRGKICLHKMRREPVNIVQLNLAYMKSLHTSWTRWFDIIKKIWLHKHSIEALQSEIYKTPGNQLISASSAIGGNADNLDTRDKLYLYNLTYFDECYSKYFPNSTDVSSIYGKVSRLVNDMNEDISSGQPTSPLMAANAIPISSSRSNHRHAERAETIIGALEFGASSQGQQTTAYWCQELKRKNIFIAKPIHRMDLNEMGWLVLMTFVL